MKNLFILPTDRPSRLAGSEYITNEQGIDKRAFKLKLWDKIIPNKDLRDVGYIPQHIYITSDEEIKEGDWCYNIDADIWAKCKIPLGYKDYKKIILTTDQDLIKDDVQAIDDEFLEWFVKNPSCEEVEVELVEDSEDHPEIEGGYKEEWSYYEIIIPKEEPKQEKCIYCENKGYIENHTGSSKIDCLQCNIIKEEPKTNLEKLPFPELVKEFEEYYKNVPLVEEKEEEPNFYEKLVEYFKNTPREKILEDWNKTAECDNIGPTVEEFLGNTEETLEQAAVRLYPDNIIKLGNETSYNAALLKRKDFIKGGNWVKERSYSEEEVLNILYEHTEDMFIGTGLTLTEFQIKEWLKLFKKK